MAEAERKGYSGKFNEELLAAFSLGSGGIGYHLSAIRKYFNNSSFSNLSPEEARSVYMYACNYLATPYAQKWVYGERIRQRIFPNKPCINTPQHRFLFIKTIEEYADPLPIGRDDDKLIKKAIHKLGCMLALTEQILFDAQSSGEPIPASYKPVGEIWERDWPRLLDKPLPTIEELYLQAYEVFKTYADPDDAVIAHLLQPPNLSYFSR